MEIKKEHTHLIPFLLALAAAALFGLAAPASKVLLESLNPVSLAGLLYLGASLGLFPVLASRKEFRSTAKMDRGNLGKLAGAVVLGGMAGPILLLIGLKQASASSVSLWLNLEMAATALLGLLLFREHLGLFGSGGILLALASGIILALPEGTSGRTSALCVGLACLCWGFDNHFTALIDGISAVQSTFIKGLVAGTVNFFAGYLVWGTLPRAGTLFAALALGSVAYGMSIVLYIISAQRLGATRSQVIFSGAPFFGVLFSVMVLSESVSGLQWISMILFLASVALLALERHEHLHRHRAVEHTHFHRHDDLHHDHEHEGDVSYHEHSHRHEGTTHSHPHWPDLHHRHEHDDH